MTRYLQFPGVLITLRGSRKRRHKPRVDITTAEHGTVGFTRAEAAYAIRAFRRAMRDERERQLMAEDADRWHGTI